MVGDGSSPRDALVRRQRRVMLYVAYQQIKRVLRVWLDVFELVEGTAHPGLVELDVIAILDFIKSVLRAVLTITLALAAMLAHRFRVDPRV